MTRRTVHPTAFDHKSKMRLIEHGAAWVDTGLRSPLRPGMTLLEATDGYGKWWPLTHVEKAS